MKYLVRTLMMLVFIPGAIVNMVGLFASALLSILQIPIGFILNGEFLEDDDTVLVWYIEHVMGWAGDMWEKMLKLSRE